MTITTERAEALSAVLNADIDRAKEWLTMEPAEVVAKINALGYDFTVEELNEYGAAVKAAMAEGELDADQLDNVSGGSVLVYVGAVAIAAAVGACVGGLEKAKIW